MSTSSSRLDELLVRWEEERALGRAPEPEVLCRDCPELLPALKRILADLGQLDALLDTAASSHRGTPGGAASDAPAPGSPLPNLGEVATHSRYRNLRFHARGGLGEVVVAEDLQLHRDVALKLIKAPLAADPVQVQRFLMEAEVTGKLEHPGVVPVLGVGQTGDGRPCYAMRFIRGQTLKDAIQEFHAAGRTGEPDAGERRLALRQLLARFVAVCNTIAYAHSRGILHRDLKPENIMLGGYGETLVVDWGLAKPFDRDETARATGEETLEPRYGSGGEATQLGRARGTPAYMSPEQASGLWDLVGPSSDIYSLGATLYYLLTGKLALAGSSRDEMLLRARRGEFPPPRQVNAEVPRPLEAICLRAMAHDPKKRYATAQDLAADLERWLAEEPVSAYRDPFSTRLWRWIRRHRQLSTAALVLLLTLPILFGVGSQLERQARHREMAAREREAANFARARLAIDHLMLRIIDDLSSGPPDLAGIRDDLLESVKDYYTDSLQDPGRSDAERAASHLRLALLGANAEDLVGTFNNFTRARDLLDKVLQEEPELSRPQLRMLSGIYRGRPGGSIQHWGLPRRDPLGQHVNDLRNQAPPLWQKLAAANPDNLDLQRDLGGLWNLIGLLHVSKDPEDRDQAAEAFQQAIRIFEAVRTAASEEGVDVHLNTFLGNYAELLYRGRRPAEAREQIRKGERLIRTIVLKRPNHPMHQADLAGTLYQLGLVSEALGQTDEARRHYQEALAIYRKLSQENPAMIFYHRELAAALRRLAALDQMHDSPAAAARFQEARAILLRIGQDYRRAARLNPTVSGSWFDLACICSLEAAAAAEGPSRQQRIQEGIEHLRESWNTGHFDGEEAVAHLREHPDLASLRGHDAARQLQARIERGQKLLQHAREQFGSPYLTPEFKEGELRKVLEAQTGELAAPPRQRAQIMALLARVCADQNKHDQAEQWRQKGQSTLAGKNE